MSVVDVGGDFEIEQQLGKISLDSQTSIMPIQLSNELHEADSTLEVREMQINRKIEAIRRKDEERMKRAAEIQEDKEQARKGRLPEHKKDRPSSSNKRNLSNSVKESRVESTISSSNFLGHGRGRGPENRKSDQKEIGSGRGRGRGIAKMLESAKEKERERKRKENIESYNKELREISEKEDDVFNKQTNREMRSERATAANAYRKYRHFWSENVPVCSKEDDTMSMTGKERQLYDEWKKERSQIEADRIKRHKQTTGQWRREWDQDKAWDNNARQWTKARKTKEKPSTARFFSIAKDEREETQDEPWG